jgi:hypothetical protein
MNTELRRVSCFHHSPQPPLIRAISSERGQAAGDRFQRVTEPDKAVVGPYNKLGQC